MKNTSKIALHIVLLLALLAPILSHAVAAFPYPQVRSYPYGFKPNPQLGSWAADSAAILTMYNNWKSNKVTSAGAGGGGRLRVQRDGSDGNDTVSEGISYGMLLAVYFNDQVTFDGLWGYKQLHNDGLGLMHWRINSGGGTTGYNSATDADEDIAYSLFLAHNQWGSGGTLNYKALGDTELQKIKWYDLDSNRVKPGDSFNACRYPSYFFPNEYRVFALQDGDYSTWNSVRNNSYSTIAAARNNTTGLIAEQCTDTGTGGGCGVSSGQYLYNSCRVPWRMAMDYVYYGDSNANAELMRLETFFAARTAWTLGDCFWLDGNQCSSNNNGAFVGPGATAFMRGGGAKLQEYYNHLLSGLNHTNDYYEGAIQLLTLLLLSGNMPNIADPSTIFSPTPTFTVTPYAGTPTMTPPPSFGIVFEDFETGLSSDYNYPGLPDVSHSISFTEFNGGANSLNVNLATAGYSGVAFNSSYAAGNGVKDMTGATNVRIWVKTDTTFTFQLKFLEGNGAPEGGGDQEVWASPPITAVGGAGWVEKILDLAFFTEDMYNGICNPTFIAASPCATMGNNSFDLGSVKTATLAFDPGITAVMHVDDIEFILSTPPTPTFTSTPFNDPFNVMFDDMEATNSLDLVGPPIMTGVFSDTANGASVSIGLDTGTVVAGLNSGAITYNSGGAGSYGVGAYLLSPYSTEVEGWVDVNDAVYLGMWINAAPNTQYRFALGEAGDDTTPVNGADGESWESSWRFSPATSGWQFIQVPVLSFSEDLYNPMCNPSGLPASPCSTGGNNTIDTQAISTVSLKINGNQGSGTLYFDDVKFITTMRTATPSATYSGTPSASPTPFLNPFTQMFDDIEDPLSLNWGNVPPYAGTFADGANGASATINPQAGTVYSGLSSGEIVYNTGTGLSYGAGGFLNSPYSDTAQVVDASGAVFLEVWINVPAGLQFSLAWTEAGNTTTPHSSGADGEAFESPAIVATGGGWERILVDLSSFSEDLFNPDCAPNCDTTGNNMMDFGGVTSVSVKIAGVQGSGSFFFDDVAFITTFKSPTPTITSSPADTETYTPTISPSPTMPAGTDTDTPTGTPTGTATSSSTPTDTATHTPTLSNTDTFTATLTETPTITLTPTQTVTETDTPNYSPTDSPTETPYAGTPTSTYTATPTLTDSPTLTHTSTPMDTPTNTPVDTFTNTPVNTPTNTPVDTPTNTPIVPTATFTFSPVGTLTNTPIIPTATFTFSPMGTLTNTPIIPTATFTFSPMGTLTNTPMIPTATFTFSPMGTLTNTPIIPTVTFTYSPMGTLTNTPVNPTSTFTNSPAATLTNTPMPTATSTFTVTPIPIINPITITGGSPVAFGIQEGSVFVLEGTGFMTGMNVQVGGMSVINVKVLSSTQAEVTLAALAPGVYDVTAANMPGGTPSTVTNMLTVNGLLEGPAKISEHYAAPNPMAGPGGVVNIHLMGSADEIEIKVYTKAMTAVGMETIPSAGGQFDRPGWYAVPFPAEFLNQAANGIYHYVIITKRDGADTGERVTGKVFLLR